MTGGPYEYLREVNFRFYSPNCLPRLILSDRRLTGPGVGPGGLRGLARTGLSASLKKRRRTSVWTGPSVLLRRNPVQRTPFYNYHVEHDAHFVDFAGWEMPIRYGSILDEHRRVRESGRACLTSRIWAG